MPDHPGLVGVALSQEGAAQVARLAARLLRHERVVLLGATAYASATAALLRERLVAVADRDPGKQRRDGWPAVMSMRDALRTMPDAIGSSVVESEPAMLQELLANPDYAGQPVYTLSAAHPTPIARAALHGMTLDEDDVQCAREWLRRAEAWQAADERLAFEEEFANWIGSRAAVAFASGRAALAAALHAVGLRPGDEVLLAGFTCVAVSNAVRFAGLEPRFCDIELDTYGVSIDSVSATLTPRVKAIIVQHLFGLVCRDYDAVLRCAAERGIAVIEDCAHATGARYQGRRVGTRGAVGVFSSEQSKTMCTMLGGVAVSDDADVARRLRDAAAAWPPMATDQVERLLAATIDTHAAVKGENWGWARDVIARRWSSPLVVPTLPSEVAGLPPAAYQHAMSAPVAALARLQLAKLDRYNAERRYQSRRWDAWCAAQDLPRPLVLAASEPVFLRYPTRVEPARKADTAWAETSLGVPIGRWFESQLHPASVTIPHCPKAIEAVATCINLPCLLRDPDA